MTETIRVIVVLSAVALSMWWAQLRPGNRNQYALRLAAFSWVWLILAETLFLRQRSVESALSQQFGLAAQAEALTWAIVGMFLTALCVRFPSLGRGLFQKPLAWASLFTVLAVASSAWSVAPLFSLVWSSKLIVLLIVLSVFSTTVTRTDEIVATVRVASVVYVTAALAPFWLALIDPSASPFWDHRGVLPAGSIATSEAAAIALILLVTLRDLTKQWWPIVLMPAIVVALYLGLGKTAIVGAMVSLVLYISMTRGARSAWGLVAYGCAILASALTANAFFPLVGEHLRVYIQDQNFVTISGRTLLWEEAEPRIAERWLLGHGYVASRFFYNEVLTPYLVFVWGESASSLHNVIFDVLYNNGVIGVAILVGLNISTVRALTRAWQARRWHNRDFELSVAACVVVYVSCLINGITAAYFGGVPHRGFVTYLTSVTGAHILATIGVRASLAREGRACSPMDSGRERRFIA